MSTFSSLQNLNIVQGITTENIIWWHKVINFILQLWKQYSKCMQQEKYCSTQENKICIFKHCVIFIIFIIIIIIIIIII